MVTLSRAKLVRIASHTVITHTRARARFPSHRPHPTTAQHWLCLTWLCMSCLSATVGAPRPGVTRNKPKKVKKDIVWNEMIQLQASQGAVESRPNTLNLTVMKGKKITGVAFAAGASEPGIDLSTMLPDVPIPMTAVLKVQDKKKGWVEKGSIKVTCNFVSSHTLNTLTTIHAALRPPCC